MKRILFLCLLLLTPFVVPAVESGQALYVGGTVAALKEGALGNLDTTSQTALLFNFTSGKLEIPFASMDSYEYSEKVARHLGVVPAVGASLIRHRQRRHFFEIRYHDENKVPQVAIFEVPKDMPQTLLAVLQTRAPQGCKPETSSPCGVKPKY